ncbi:hypothetical protein RclHR1_01700016 [Rhizophagus clarus]|uniref:Protein kinase domain-containing protein n=1 Tax=Rhizophagus clarus TaxID=94130 RepID=A0A2Z6QJ37_9GLOM|nr:hypothetical protein RclHR1_01700016 [Rhizophagus clarus]
MISINRVSNLAISTYYEIFDLACLKSSNINEITKYNFYHLLSENKTLNEQEKEYCKQRFVRNMERNKERDKSGKPMTCEYCNSTRYSERYCVNCIRRFLKSKFRKWSSGDITIDKFIQKIQMQASVPPFILEWIPSDQFKDIKYLTKGGFSKIYCAKWKRGPIMDWDEEKRGFIYEGTVDVVLKSLNEFNKRFYDEVNNYFKIKSGNLVKYYGITKLPNSNNYVMVMNYYKEGTLRDYLKSHQSQINLKDKIYFIYRICFALYRIHSNNYIHRDLHSANILLLTNRCLISDLGLCGPAENKLADTMYGVLPYMAPELILNGQYSKASDIYSLGMLMWEIFAEYPPFYDHSQLYLKYKIISDIRPPMLSKIPDKFQHMIQKCWDKDVNKRPRIEEIYKTVNEEFINVYENIELIQEYENKCVTEFAEIPGLSHPIHYNRSTDGMSPTESLIINAFIINENLNTCYTSSSLRNISENSNEKVLYNVINKTSDVFNRKNSMKKVSREARSKL